MSVLQSPQEFGRRIGAARGYMPHPRDKKTNFAKMLGTSVPTLSRMEAGEVGSLGTSVEERRQLAERVVAVTGVPASLFEISEPEPTEVDQMKTALADLTETTSRQAAEMVLLQRGQEDLRSRVERLEHGGAGTGT